MSDVQIDLGDVTFNTGIPGTPGPFGCRYRMGIPDGWESPPMRGGDGEPTGMHGGFELEALHGTGVLVCRGVVYAPTQAAAWEAYNYLPTLSRLGQDVDLVVHEPGVPKWLQVRRAGRPDIDRPSGGVVQFTLPVKALYPFKRALTPVEVLIIEGASPTFTADGIEAAEVTIEATTGGTIHLSIGGLTLTTGDNTVEAGTVFSTLDRTVEDPSGVNLYNVLAPDSQWPAISPGANTAVNGGTADLALTYHPTY